MSWGFSFHFLDGFIYFAYLNLLVNLPVPPVFHWLPVFVNFCVIEFVPWECFFDLFVFPCVLGSPFHFLVSGGVGGNEVMPRARVLSPEVGTVYPLREDFLWPGSACLEFGEAQLNFSFDFLKVIIVVSLILQGLEGVFIIGAHEVRNLLW